MVTYTHIQSRETGKVYTYNYTYDSGMHAYKDADNFLIVVSEEEIERYFSDVTELETKLRTELVKERFEVCKHSKKLRCAACCPHNIVCLGKGECDAIEGKTPGRGYYAGGYRA